MAKFKVTSKTTVAELKEQFGKEIGGVLRVYQGRSEAADGATLVSLGAKEGELECRTSRTVGKFEEAFQHELNLKVKVYTRDNWVKVLDGITLAVAAELPNGMTKAKMEEYLSYKRNEKEKENVKAVVAETPKGAYPTYEEFVAKYPAGPKGDRYKISEDGKRMYDISDSLEGSLVVPEGVEVVEFGDNDRIEGLTAIVMPDSVKEMRGWLNCNYSENLKAIRLSPNMKLSNEAFYSLTMEELVIPEGITLIPSEAFKNSNLKKVTLPSSLQFILPSAFERCELEEVVIPENVKVVFPHAFSSNSDLKKVTILSPDTIVMKGAFEDCDELPYEEVLYEGRELGDFTCGQDELVYGDVEEKNWRGEVKDVRFKLISIPEYYCGPLRLKDGVKDYPDIENYAGITELYIPDSVEERYPRIPVGVRKVRLPDSLEIVNLEKKANLVEFNWPTSAKEFRISEAPFESLIVPEGVEEVDIHYMPNLREIKLPKSVRKIDISHLPKLERCVIPENVDEISNGSFGDCPLIEEIILPANLKVVPYRFANDSAKLSKVVIPDSVETIGGRAFSGQTELRRIVIPASVKKIEAGAFSRCPNLEEVIVEGSPMVFPEAFEDTPG
ncbi:MAG: leucine-rich repeat domain-containing protein, partial [Muribaculaceae bacterium]|nr:leucine-rich repeat domain-containing protein [Muribaculaceae bacterium]